jgi:thiol-disulfide isomerase/thioredoxin
MRKIFLICLVGILLLHGIGAVALNNDTDTHNSKTTDIEVSRNENLAFTHSVLGEFGTATWCGYCKYAHGALKELYAEGELDFYYVTLVCDKNGKAQSRASQLGLTGYPTLFWDGTAKKDVGAGSIPSAKAAYTSSINYCGSRTVKDIDISLGVSWLGGTKMHVDVSVKNNEGSTYDGHIRAYIVEFESSMGWYDSGGYIYTMPFLDYAFDESISISVGGTWDDSVTWDGSPQYTTVTEGNIMVIASVFESNRVDDTVAATPGSGGAPNTPSKPNGPSEGVVDTEYEFSTKTQDPQEDDVYYLFSWGDGTDSGWLGPFPEDTTQSASHSWEDGGEYKIKVKAKDVNGAESEWSIPHTIHIYSGPGLDISSVSGGLFRVSALIRNPGILDATDVSWTISLDGGTILLGKECSGEMSTIPAGEEKKVNSKLILGFGSTRITVTAEMPDGPSDSYSKGASVFLFFIKVNPGG